MGHRLRRARLVILLDLAALAATSGYAAHAHASSGSTGSPRNTDGMRMIDHLRQTSRTVVLKHRHTVRVSIHDMAFGPAHLVVSPRTRIIWTNRDGFEHTTTSDQGLWNSKSMNPGATFGRVFKKAGTFTYHCTIHPFMHGTVTVAK